VPYETLVSTIPLPELIRLLRPPRPALLDLSVGLRHVSVACVNLGFAPGPPVTRHWVYFPEPRFDFFRAGCYSALADAPGRSFFVEFARPAGAPLPAGLRQRALDGLRACGLVPGDTEPVAADVIDLAYAYVVHDRARSSIVPRLRAWLREHGIRTAGRYGDWQYGSMESALLAGRSAAAELG
jgi:protoporphyrinogen oxidase